MKAKDLRNSILQYAMQGRLVPQNLEDESVKELINNIKIEQERFLADNKIRKPKPPLPISHEDVPFTIPESWEWVRLSQVGCIISGGTPKTSDPLYWDPNGIVWLTPKDMGERKEMFISDSSRKISKLGLENSSAKLIPEGSIVFSSRAPIGYINIVETEYTTNQGCKSVVPFIYNKFLYYALKSFSTDIEKMASGTTFKEISGGNFSQTLIALPPLKEQKRIVDKIEELFKRVNQYDVLEDKLSSLNENFPINMEKSILQYAMRGKLVSQNPNDESVETLMMKVKNEKKKLGKKKSNLSVINSENIPFEIPTTWKWTKLDDISIPVGTSKNKILKRDILTEGMIPVITQGKNFIDGYTNEIDKTVKLSSPVIMFGDHTRNVKFIDFDFVIGADGTKFFQPILINPKYLYYWTIFAADEIKNRGYGRHYSLLKKELIPLPPLNEQDRIVNTVNALLLKIKNYKELPLDSKY